MFDPYVMLALSPVAGLMVNCLTHVLVTRATGGRRHYPCLAAGFVAGLAATAGVSIEASLAGHSAQADAVALLAINLLAYIGLAYGYFAFVNLNLTSLRIRILLEMLAAGGVVSRPDLLSRYNTDNAIAARIERLLSTGHLRKKGDRFYTGRRSLLLIAAVVELLRWIVFGRRGRRGNEAPARPAEGVR